MAGRGAPLGNNNAAKTKRWLAAIERHAQQNPDKLATMAAKVFDLALEGEPWAVQEIANRLDGKPVQQVEMSGSMENTSYRDLSDAMLAEIAAGALAKRKANGKGETIQ